MPPVTDFRTLTFTFDRLDASGLSVGRADYRKLYVIENTLRVAIHSVLSVQIGQNWWGFAVGAQLQGKVQALRLRYAASPGRTPAGRHDIYYTFLPDLNDILLPNSHLFEPVIPDIDQWIVRVEKLWNPRNLVGHVNWPSATDRKLIQETFREARRLPGVLGGAGVAVLIP